MRWSTDGTSHFLNEIRKVSRCLFSTLIKTVLFDFPLEEQTQETRSDWVLAILESFRDRAITIPLHPRSQGISRTLTYHVQNSVSTSLLSILCVKLYTQIVPLKSRTKWVYFTHWQTIKRVSGAGSARKTSGIDNKAEQYLCCYLNSDSRHRNVSSRICFKHLSTCSRMLPWTHAEFFLFFAIVYHEGHCTIGLPSKIWSVKVANQS